MEKNQIHPRVYVISFFAFLYTFTRQTFLPGADAIGIPGLLDVNNIYSIVNITSIFGFIYSCLQIPYGIAIDLLGINRMVTLLTGTMTVGLLICALSTSDIMFFIGRIITVFGCGGAFISTVKTHNYELGQERTSKTIGMIVAGAVSFAIGFVKYGFPFMKSIPNGWRYFYGIKAMIVGLVFVYFFRLQKKTYISEQQQKREIISFKECVISMINNPKMLLLVAFTFIFFMIFYSINETPYMANYLHHTLNMTTSNSYAFLLIGFLSGFITTPFIISMIGNGLFCYIMNILLIIFAFIMLKIPSVIMAYIFLFFVGYSNGLQMVVVGLASLEINKKYMGMLTGIFNCLFLAGSIIPQQFFIRTIKNFSDTVMMFYFVMAAALGSIILITIYNRMGSNTIK